MAKNMSEERPVKFRMSPEENEEQVRKLLRVMGPDDSEMQGWDRHALFLLQIDSLRAESDNFRAIAEKCADRLHAAESSLRAAEEALEKVLAHFDENFEWNDCHSEDSWIALRTIIREALARRSKV